MGLLLPSATKPIILVGSLWFSFPGFILRAYKNHDFGSQQYMIYFGLDVLFAWLLWGLSIRYVGTWILWERESDSFLHAISSSVVVAGPSWTFSSSQNNGPHALYLGERAMILDAVDIQVIPTNRGGNSSPLRLWKASAQGSADGGCPPAGPRGGRSFPGYDQWLYGCW